MTQSEKYFQNFQNGSLWLWDIAIDWDYSDLQQTYKETITMGLCAFGLPKSTDKDRFQYNLRGDSIAPRDAYLGSTCSKVSASLLSDPLATVTPDNVAALREVFGLSMADEYIGVQVD